MGIHLTVAKNMKQLREQKKLTLDAAAAATGVSRSMLAQIERGEVNPTVSVLWKIANGYKVSFTSLLEDKGTQADYFPVSCVTPVTADEGRYVNYPTFAFDEQRLFELYRIVIAPGGQLEAQPHLVGTEEYITVFAGEVEVTVGERDYRLAVGDSLRFRADLSHGYRNCGQEEAQLSMLIYYS